MWLLFRILLIACKLASLSTLLSFLKTIINCFRLTTLIIFISSISSSCSCFISWRVFSVTTVALELISNRTAVGAPLRWALGFLFEGTGSWKKPLAVLNRSSSLKIGKLASSTILGGARDSSFLRILSHSWLVAFAFPSILSSSKRYLFLSTAWMASKL